MLPCVFSVIDHRIRQNVVKTSVMNLTIASCATLVFCMTSTLIHYWKEANRYRTSSSRNNSLKRNLWIRKKLFMHLSTDHFYFNLKLSHAKSKETFNAPGHLRWFQSVSAHSRGLFTFFVLLHVRRHKGCWQLLDAHSKVCKTYQQSWLGSPSN